GVQRRREPIANPRPRRAATARPGRPLLPAPGLVTIAPAFLLMGAMFAAIDLSTVAFAAELGHRPVAGIILGTYALGSAVGGLWYGSRHWRGPLQRGGTITAAPAPLRGSAVWGEARLRPRDAPPLLAAA